MILKNLMDKILVEREKKDSNDGFGIEECWDKMVELLSKNTNETIEYLQNCSEEEIYFISEVFEDISDRLQSPEYILCLRELEKKFPDLDLAKDVDLAERYLN